MAMSPARIADPPDSGPTISAGSEGIVVAVGGTELVVVGMSPDGGSSGVVVAETSVVGAAELGMDGLVAAASPGDS